MAVRFFDHDERQRLAREATAREFQVLLAHRETSSFESEEIDQETDKTLVVPEPESVSRTEVDNIVIRSPCLAGFSPSLSLYHQV